MVGPCRPAAGRGAGCGRHLSSPTERATVCLFALVDVAPATLPNPDQSGKRIEHRRRTDFVEEPLLSAKTVENPVDGRALDKPLPADPAPLQPLLAQIT